MTLFEEQYETEAIERIQKFSKIASLMQFEIVVGFSGGKDSQVVYDLCKRSGIKFKACFNHSFESKITLNFIREHYPEVIWRRDYHCGFIENIWRNHNCLLPTVEISYCCKDYKHNPSYIDDAAILGVRKAESQKRSKRKVLTLKNRSLQKANKDIVSQYFLDQCVGTGSPDKIQLLPIVDWTNEDVWNYIRAHNLPINPEYRLNSRVGCIVCPKANLNSNAKALFDNPKWIDAFIKARSKRPDIDWVIQSLGKDFSTSKAEYICRWLNRSFRPLTKKQEALMNQILEKYEELHKK